MSLADFPEIANQWHPTKNGDLMPSDVSCQSHKMVWWICPIRFECGCVHEYQQQIKDKFKGQGCPYCVNKKICYHRSLEYKYPAVSKQWHPTKNGDLLPSDVSCQSHKMVWWLCENTCEYGCIHEYQQLVKSKTMGYGCPYCAPNPRKICYHQSLQFQCPEIAAQWHPTKNGDLLPAHFTVGSDAKVWWLCPNSCSFGCLHEYQQKIEHKTRGSGCPYCSQPPQKNCFHQSLEFKFPELSQQWHPTKNGELLPSQVSCGSEKKVFWCCPIGCIHGCDHVYEQTIYNRIKGMGCPYCSQPPKAMCVHQSLQFQYPDVAQQWHPTKNGNRLPSTVFAHSHEMIWWICPNKCYYGCIHEYQQCINNKTIRGDGCPYCAPNPQKICYHNSLEFLHPNVAKLWHPTKNGNLTPANVTQGSGIKVWWLCENGHGHEYEQMITSKTHGAGCPKCHKNYSNMQIIWLDFIAVYENLAIQHGANGGEFKIPHTNYRADGYCQETNTIYEFHGDYWHGNPQIYNSNDLNIFTKTTFGELYTKTITKEMKLKELGYHLVIMWENDWIRINNSIRCLQQKLKLSIARRCT